MGCFQSVGTTNNTYIFIYVIYEYFNAQKYAYIEYISVNEITKF